MATKDNHEKYAALMLALHHTYLDVEMNRLVEDLSALLLADEEITKSQFNRGLYYEICSRERGVVDLVHGTGDGIVRINSDGSIEHHPSAALVDPALAQGDQTVTRNATLVDSHELNRLRECCGAWEAVFNQLLAFNPEFCRGQGSGKDLALIEIMRLQLIAHHNRNQTVKGG